VHLISAALCAVAMAACGREEPAAPADTVVTGSQALDVFEAGGQRLEVSADLPIDGKSVFHYRFIGADQQAALELTSDNTQQIKPFFATFTPELKERMKGLVAQRLAAPRQHELLGFYQVEQGVLEASESDKVLYCSSHTDCQLSFCCRPGYGDSTCFQHSCSGWWIFCSCSDSYYTTGCRLNGGCG
jgi:hypothetical protein